MPPEQRGPLHGIRVIDLTSVVFGPYATRILGDMGADVIKVEAPEGDVLRGIEPSRSPGMGAVFLNTNRNKRSLVLDLKAPAARAALLKVVAGADVFVHSLRPQAVEKLGLTYDALAAVQPKLIYCSAWGFGSDGPYARRPAYDDIIQAMAGVADLPRRQDATAEPSLAPTILADKTAGLTVAYAVAMALFHRERSGQGQALEVPMFETLVSYTLLEHLSGAVFEPPEESMGYPRVLAPHRRPYATADGYVTVLPYTTRQWRAFFTVAGRPEMLEDPRVNDPATRSRAIGELYALIAEVMPERTTAEWLSRLEAADIPATRVNSLEDLLTDPHLTATGFFADYDHPSEGRLRTTMPPVRFAETPGRLHRPAPRLGEHTREILKEAGLDDAAIEHLVTDPGEQPATDGQADETKVRT